MYLLFIMYVSLRLAFEYFLFSQLLFMKLLIDTLQAKKRPIHNILVAVKRHLIWFTEDTYLIYEANTLVPKC